MNADTIIFRADRHRPLDGPSLVGAARGAGVRPTQAGRSATDPCERHRKKMARRAARNQKENP